MLGKAILFTVILLIGVISGFSEANVNRPSNIQTTTNSQAVPSNSGMTGAEYREILDNERKLLDDQSEKYYSRVDSLFNKTIYGIGLLVTIVLFIVYRQYGKTREEFKNTLHEQFEKQIQPLIDKEIEPINNRLKDLNFQVGKIDEFQTRLVVWVHSGDEDAIQEELDALRATGLQNISTLITTEGGLIELGNPDLVIYSYDGTVEARGYLTEIVQILRNQSPPVSLLIYTYNPEGRDVRLNNEDLEILSDFRWYLPVNFPTSLIAQSQMLVRTRNSI